MTKHVCGPDCYTAKGRAKINHRYHTDEAFSVVPEQPLHLQACDRDCRAFLGVGITMQGCTCKGCASQCECPCHLQPVVGSDL